MPSDSTNKPISEGDKVRFRGQEYTIKEFRPGEGRYGTAAIKFEEDDVHTDEIPDELSVDRVDNYEDLKEPGR